MRRRRTLKHAWNVWRQAPAARAPRMTVRTVRARMHELEWRQRFAGRPYPLSLEARATKVRHETAAVVGTDGPGCFRPSTCLCGLAKWGARRARRREAEMVRRGDSNQNDNVVAPRNGLANAPAAGSVPCMLRPPQPLAPGARRRLLGHHASAAANTQLHVARTRRRRRHTWRPRVLSLFGSPFPSFPCAKGQRRRPARRAVVVRVLTGLVLRPGSGRRLLHTLRRLVG